MTFVLVTNLWWCAAHGVCFLLRNQKVLERQNNGFQKLSLWYPAGGGWTKAVEFLLYRDACTYLFIFHSSLVVTGRYPSEKSSTLYGTNNLYLPLLPYKADQLFQSWDGKRSFLWRNRSQRFYAVSALTF